MMTSEAVVDDIVEQLKHANKARMDLARRLTDAEANAARYLWLRDYASSAQWERASHATPGTTDAIVDAMKRGE